MEKTMEAIELFKSLGFGMRVRGFCKYLHSGG